MDKSNQNPDLDGKIKRLKAIVTLVYVCQLASYLFAGLPLLLGLALNFANRKEAEGTWLMSHFEWQMASVWITLLGIVLAGMSYAVFIGLVIFALTLLHLLYRIVTGWQRLLANQKINVHYFDI